MDRLQFIQQLMRCKQQDLPITYLGMPLNVKRPTRNDFMPLIKKLEKRLDGWKARFISRAGKLQLVKSVLSTVPTYFMSCFQFPKWLIQRIDAIRRRFLWSRNERNRSMCLMNWQRVCLPEKCGGMGIINLQLQNMALLLRWLWRLYEPTRHLWGTYATMLHTVKPSQNGPIILARSGSFFWRSVLGLRQLFHSCVNFQMVSGKKISFWHDAWAGQPLADTTVGPIPLRCVSLYEAKQLLQQLLPAPLTRHHHEAAQVLAQFAPQHGADKVVWNLSPSGTFSVNSVYKVLSHGGKLRSATAGLWKARVTPSMKCFFFLLLNDRILTHQVMLRRGIQCEPTCVMCASNQLETAMHLFFRCSYAAQIWDALSAAEGYRILVVRENVSLTYLASVPTLKQRGKPWSVLFITTVWLLWRERNDRIFRNKQTPTPVLINRIRHEALLCLRYC